MAEVFISFVHEDGDVASAVQYLLQKELTLGEEVFLSSDESQMFAGDLWLEKIRHSLLGARVVLLLLSNRSVKRPWVNFEAGVAWFSQHQLLFVRTTTLAPHEIPLPINSRQI